MHFFLKISYIIDWVNDRLGVIAGWAVVASCLISCINALIRFTFNVPSYLGWPVNSWLEVQWYLFAACVMFGASHVLRVNEHVRVDVLYGQYSTRLKVWIDVLGLSLFLIPVMIFATYLSYPLFLKMFLTNEMSQQSGGLPRWWAMISLPIGFSMVVFQGFSELIKRVGWLLGKHEMNLVYERPLQ